MQRERGGTEMPAWLWLVIGFGLLAAETTRGDFYLVSLGIGALIAAALAASPIASLSAFVLIAAGLIVAVRPRVIRRWLPAPTPDPPHQLIGQIGLVERTIPANGRFGGTVEVDGRRYSAKSFWGESIEPGILVEVMSLEGVQLTVHPVDLPFSPLPESISAASNHSQSEV